MLVFKTRSPIYENESKLHTCFKTVLFFEYNLLKLFWEEFKSFPLSFLSIFDILRIGFKTMYIYFYSIEKFL